MSTKSGLESHIVTHRNPEERAKERAQKAKEGPPKPKVELLCQECGKTFNKMCKNKDHKLLIIMNKQ